MSREAEGDDVAALVTQLDNDGVRTLSRCFPAVRP